MEEDSNYRKTDQSVHGLTSRSAAESIKALTERGLKKQKVEEDYILRVDEQPGGTFDLIVLKRIN